MSEQRYDDAAARQDAPPPTPRWVQLLGVAAVIVITVLILALIGGGHSPGRHGG